MTTSDAISDVTSDAAGAAADFAPAPGSADIGVYGLGVMGANLARNLARHGHSVAVFNRTPARTRRLMELASRLLYWRGKALDRMGEKRETIERIEDNILVFCNF